MAMHPYHREGRDPRDSEWDDISTAAKLRKIRKPLVERKRRERINSSLMELKSLILQAMCKKESDYEKMEKADILEMTVHFLRTLHQTQRVNANRKYHDGFQECANEVRRYLGSVSGVEDTVRRRMEHFLSSRVVHRPEVIKPEVTRLPHIPIPLTSPLAFLPPAYYSASQETPLCSSLPNEDYQRACASLSSAPCVSSVSSTESTVSSTTDRGTPPPAGVRRTLFSQGQVKVKEEPRDPDTDAVGQDRSAPSGEQAGNTSGSSWRPWS